MTLAALNRENRPSQEIHIMEAAARRFFSSQHFAVAGASQDRSKFGFRILAWYHEHSLPVTPINPGRPSIALPSKTYHTVASVSALQNPSQTAVSFLTPPAVTRKVLAEAKSAGVKAVWLQPGSFDDEDLKFAMDNFESAIGGYEEGTVGGEGWCVLVDGENMMRSAGRKFARQKL
jgi:predicted CoA-binding protein